LQPLNVKFRIFAKLNLKIIRKIQPEIPRGIAPDPGATSKRREPFPEALISGTTRARFTFCPEGGSIYESVSATDRTFKRTFLMTGAIAQDRKSCQFLFCLMKNPLLYRSARSEGLRFLTITGGSSIAAMIFKAPPQFGQRLMSISKTRFSSRA
jgi:hypothetical protein